jgi:hypothetical protein
MLRSEALRRLALVCLTILWPSLLAAAELPTAAEILKIHRANKERLAHLHLQVTHEFENWVPGRENPEQFRFITPTEFFLDGED